LRKRRKAMTKLAVLCLATVLATVAGTGCASTQSDIEEAMSAYLDASLHDRNEEAYSYLSERYRSAVDLDGYIARKEEQIVIECNEFTKRTTFDVKGIDLSGDRATAEVEITEPDLRVMMKDLVGVFVAWVFNDDEELERLKAETEETYTEGNIPMTSRLVYYDLVRENGMWKVDLEP
jgi:hypothetical protein